MRSMPLRLALYLALLACSTGTLSAQEHGVFLPSDGVPRPASAQDWDAFRGGQLQGVMWRWSAEAAPQRITAASEARKSLPSSPEVLEVEVVARSGERPATEILAAPAAMWAEVPEDLLPRVAVSWPEAGQDGPGTARIPGDTSTPWRLRGVAKGLGTGWLEVTAGQDRARLHLLPATELQLRLEARAADGVVPVAQGAVAVWTTTGPGAIPAAVASSLSNSAGGVTFASLLVSQRLQLVIQAPGFAPKVVTGTARDLAGAIPLEGGTAVTGRVVDPEGAPVPRIRVQVTTWMAPDLPEVLEHEAVSNAEGRWQVRALPPGPMAVWIAEPGYAPQRQTLEAAFGTTDVGDLLLTPDSGITLLVTDPEGNPLPNAEVKAEQRDFTTDRQGEAILYGMPTGGMLRLFVQAPGFIRTMEMVRLPTAETVHVTLQPAFLVTGRVLDPEGAPVSEGRVRGSIKEGRRSSGFATDLEGDGTFRLEVPPEAKGSVAISTARYLELETPITTGTAGESLDLGELHLLPGGTVVGRVLDGRDGSPLPGARVWAPKGRPDQALVQWLRGELYTAVSGPDGAFTLEGIPPGALLALRIDRPGFARLHTQAQPSAEEPLLDLGDLHLSEGATVEIHYDGDGAKATARVDLRGEGLELDELLAPVRDGVATVEHIPAGPITVKILRGAENLCEASATVPETGRLRVPCRESGVLVTGTVRVGGEPAGPGALAWQVDAAATHVVRSRTGPGGLTYTESFGSSPQPFQVEVDENGRFVAEGVKPGEWRVSWGAADGGGSVPSLQVKVPEVPRHTVTLDYGRAVIHGLVLDAAGEPVVGASVVELRGHSRAVSQEEGRFTLPLNSAGVYQIQARLQPGDLYSEPLQVEVLPDEPPPTVSLVLAASPQRVTLAIHNAAGQPQAGALVFLDSGDGRLRAWTTDAHGQTERPLTPPLPERIRGAAYSNGKWTLGDWATFESGTQLLLTEGEVGSLSITADEEGPVEIVAPGGWDLDALLRMAGNPPHVPPEAPWHLQGLPPGPYLLTVEGIPVQAEVRAGEATEVHLP